MKKDFVDINKLEDYKIGVRICDRRPLTINSINFWEKGNEYFLLINELDVFIKLDKESFDRAFKEMDTV